MHWSSLPLAPGLPKVRIELEEARFLRTMLSTDQRTMHGFAVLIIELEIGGEWNIGLGTVGCQVGLKAGCKTKCGCTPGNRTLSNQWAASSAAVEPMVKLSSCRALTVAC